LPQSTSPPREAIVGAARIAFPIARVVLVTGAPALAPGAIHCESTERSALEIYLVVGCGAAVALQDKPLTASL